VLGERARELGDGGVEVAAVRAERGLHEVRAFESERELWPAPVWYAVG
jgi:hypothetical protein